MDLASSDVSMKVRIGVGLGTATELHGPSFGVVVDTLETLGFDSLWLSERISAPAPDPTVAMAFGAGRTERLKFGMSVMVLPGRNPVVLAKELATLATMSGGRLLPAFGLGAVDPVEQQAFGVERTARAPQFDEMLSVMRKCWTGQPFSHHGERYDYEGVTVLPAPKRMDVWLGGIAPSELRRVGRLADGWLPSFTTPADVAAGIETVARVAAEHERAIDPEHYGVLIAYSRGELSGAYRAAARARRPDLDPTEIVPVGIDALRRKICEFIDVGASKFVLIPVTEPDDWSAELEEIATELLPLQTR
jgi:probable F420-dependent oxidoreductase